jgi:integrase
VLGLRWSDIDLRAGTLTVNQALVLVEYRVLIEEPKSRNGKRTLPLDGELVAALTALRKRQLEESTIAGAAYRSGLAGLDWYQGGEYVITDEAGTPVHPEWYSDEFGRLIRRAGLRRITLHDSRHTTLTLMEGRGVASDATFRHERGDAVAGAAALPGVWRARGPGAGHAADQGLLAPGCAG